MPLRILSSADFSGLLIAPACTTSNASIRLPHGTAPSGPADGDMWTTSGGLHVRINSVNFNLTSALSSQTANTFFAAPNGSSGTPSFRAIVGADIPTLNQNTTGSAATLTTPRTLTIGGTGKTFNGSADVSWTLSEIQAEYRVPINTLRNNLGNPTVREAALFQAQSNNKFRFVAPTLQEESTNGTTWTTSTRATSDQLRDMMIGDGQTTNFNAIPTGTLNTYGGYRLTWSVVAQTGYVFLDDFYVLCSTQGNNVSFKIERYHNTNGWENLAGPHSANNWPGHVYIPHTSTPYSNDPTQYSQVRVTFETNRTAFTNAFVLYSIEWAGGYFAGSRNVQTYDRDKNVYFPAGLNTSGSISVRAAATGSVATQFPVFTADPSSTTRTLVTRTPGQVLSDIGAQAALTNPVTGTGSSGRVAFWTAASTQSSNTKLFWDNTNERLGVGTSTPTQLLDVEGNGRFKSDLTVGGIILASAAGASSASLRLPHGSAPNSPTNGDMWTTASGLFVRINGATVGPLGTGGGGGSGTVTSITAGTGLSGGTITTSGTIAIDQTAQIVSTRTNSTTEGQGQIYLNGTTGNRIDFVAVGVAAPATMTRSVGTKLLLWPQAQQGGGSVDYALGISTDTLWLSVADSSKMFSFYGGTTEILRLMGDGRIRGVAGSVALPTFSAGLASGDVDTGIFFPAADTIAFAEGGTEAMRITSTANVGIGTTNPEAKLDVAGAIRASGAVTTVVAAGATMSYEGNVGAYFLSVGPNATTRGTFIFNQRESDNGGINTFLQVDNQTNIFLAQSNGNVGVGIPTASAPSSRLQVRGTGTTDSSTALRVENSAGTAALTIMDNGQLRVGAGTAGVPSISAGLNSSDTNTGIYFPGTDQMALTTGGNGRLFVSNTGVGIGLNPSMAFHCDVAGSVLIRSSNADVGINVTQALAYTHIGSDPARQSGPLYLRIDAEQVSCDPPTWQTTDFNDIYGNNGINGIILGEPDYWMEIRLGHATHSGKGGSIVLIPCYIPSNQC